MSLTFSALGCKPEIGDDCSVSTDCSSQGDRLCDISSPGGYCTIFNCEPDSCPDEALCVAFGSSLSADPRCADPQAVSPYQRTFCMARCDGDGDCRAGYVCANLREEPNAWGALVVDEGRGSRACVARQTAVQPGAAGADGLGEGGAPNVCTGSGPSLPQGGAAQD